jgi:hypothetical protein
MKKVLIAFFTALSISIGNAGSTSVVLAEKPVPSYAKWGTLAMKKTKERYPNAQIIDYLHVGKTSGPSSSTEKFKLWLKENQREFGVFVDIEFNKQTEKVINITFRETSR